MVKPHELARQPTTERLTGAAAEVEAQASHARQVARGIVGHERRPLAALVDDEGKLLVAV